MHLWRKLDVVGHDVDRAARSMHLTISGNALRLFTLYEYYKSIVKAGIVDCWLLRVLRMYISMETVPIIVSCHWLQSSEKVVLSPRNTSAATASADAPMRIRASSSGVVLQKQRYLRYTSYAKHLLVRIPKHPLPLRT